MEINPQLTINRLKRKLVKIRRKFFNRGEMTKNNIQQKFRNFKPRTKPSRTALQKILTVIGIAIVVLLALNTWATLKNDSQTNEPEPETKDRLSVDEPKKTAEINREFTYSLGSEEQPSELQYKVQKAEIVDQIVVQGKKVNTIEGRTFLIFTLALTNNNVEALEIRTRDFIRLQVGDSEERLAPDIHNDPVTIQPISTKYTRLGFPIDEGTNNFTIYIGKIGGEKEAIPLSFE